MVRLGFIGCGSINRHHAGVIRKQVDGLLVAAGADIDPAALDGFRADNPGADGCTDYRELLAREDVDAVVVGLPTGLHSAAAVAAAAAGKHVFCEKPMAMNLAAADAMIDACGAAGVKLMIGHVRRYDPDWGTFKRLVEENRIGRPLLWNYTFGSAGPGRWFMDAAVGGGPFLDMGVHNLDFANWLFGSPVETVAKLMRFRTTSAWDTGAAILRYQGGDQVLLACSWGLPAGCAGGTVMEALGPGGVIKFPGTFPLDGLPEFDRDKHGAYLVDSGSKRELVTFEKGDMYAAQWRDFRDAILQDREPRATGAVGRAAIAAALTVLETAAASIAADQVCAPAGAAVPTAP